jgi:hypothetical protein
MSRVQLSPPFQRGLKGMPGECIGGTPKPISFTLINFGVRHWRSPSRPCECEQDILPGPSSRSSPNDIHIGIIRIARGVGLRIPRNFGGNFPIRTVLDLRSRPPRPHRRSARSGPHVSRGPGVVTPCGSGIVVEYDGCIRNGSTHDPSRATRTPASCSIGHSIPAWFRMGSGYHDRHRFLYRRSNRGPSGWCRPPREADDPSRRGFRRNVFLMFCPMARKRIWGHEVVAGDADLKISGKRPLYPKLLVRDPRSRPPCSNSWRLSIRPPPPTDPPTGSVVNLARGNHE